MASATEWLDSLAAAWRAERGAARARIAIERSGRPLAERVALGIALSHLRIVDEASAYGDRVRVRVAVPETSDLDNMRLAPGDPIRLWAEHPDEPGTQWQTHDGERRRGAGVRRGSHRPSHRRRLTAPADSVWVAGVVETIPVTMRTRFTRRRHIDHALVTSGACRR